jgi:hypothetical protein
MYIYTRSCWTGVFARDRVGALSFHKAARLTHHPVRALFISNSDGLTSIAGYAWRLMLSYPRGI